MRHTSTLLALALAACTGGDDTPADTDGAAPDTDVEVGVWNRRLPPAATAIAPLRGRIHQRAVFHIHSPWSHDACDNGDGEDNPDCLADLREGLCATRFDHAFVTDHPAFGADHTWEEMFHPQPGDELVRDGGDVLENVITCEDGHRLHYRAGFESDLMPVGQRRHVAEPIDDRHTLLGGDGASTVPDVLAAGGWLFQAHTESHDLDLLKARQDVGLHAVEAFNVHAMFAPNIRKDFLGLDPVSWISDIGPFTSLDEGHAEPDLFFLTVLQEQTISVQRWDALLQRGPMMASAGTDAHQNVLNYTAADGERVDSYRRMLRWFSTMLIADADTLEAVDEAIAARRSFVAFEAIGTPTGFDLRVDADGTTYEMGSDAPAGELTVACPTLAPGSPRGALDPEITVTVFKDGEPWQQGCGTWPVTKGVYRARVDLTPHHLREFLGSADPDGYIKPYPWVYSGAIRVDMGG